MAMSSLVGGMAGAAGSSAISDILGNALGAVFSQHSAKVAFRRQKTIMKNQISWRVQDLLKAGLNPMLAVGAGVGGGGAPHVAPAAQPEARDPEVVRAATSMGEMMMAAKGQPSEIAVREATAGRQVADMDLARQSARTSAAEEFRHYVDAQLSADRGVEARASAARQVAETGLAPARARELAASAGRAEVEGGRREQGFLGRFFHLGAGQAIRNAAKEDLGKGTERIGEKMRSYFQSAPGKARPGQGLGVGRGRVEGSR